MVSYRYIFDTNIWIKVAKVQHNIKIVIFSEKYEEKFAG